MADFLNTPVSDPTEPDDLAAARALFQSNINEHRTNNPGKEFGMWDAVKAGWQGSATGLAVRGELPDTELPEDATTAQRLVSKAVGMGSELPVTAVGSLAGVEGLPGGPLGVAAAGGAGAFALPAAIRGFLMDRYAKGQYRNFGDFWSRASPVLLDTAKDAALGAVTGGAGKAAGASFEIAEGIGFGARPVAKALATGSAELAAMTATGAALNGKVPTAQDFIDNAILIGGMHAAGHVAGKLRSIYADRNIEPHKVASIAWEHPEFQNSLASDDPYAALDRYIDGGSSPLDTEAVVAPEAVAPFEGVNEAPPVRAIEDISPDGPPRVPEDLDSPLMMYRDVGAEGPPPASEAPDIESDLGEPEAADTSATKEALTNQWKAGRPGKALDEVGAEGRRGADQIIDRIKLERKKREGGAKLDVKRGEQPRAQITPEQESAVNSFIDDIGRHMFSDVGLSIRKMFKGPSGVERPGVQGEFEYTKGIVNIFESAIQNEAFDDSTVHELWHSLARFLSPQDVENVKSEFLRQRKAFTKTAPWMELFFESDNWALSGEVAEHLVRLHPELYNDPRVEVTEKHSKEFPASEGYAPQTTLRLKADENTYRFKNPDEYFAETLKDKYFDWRELRDPTTQTVWRHLKMAVSRMIQTVQNFFGYDKTSEIFDKFLRKEYEAKVQRLTIGEAGELFSARDNIDAAISQGAAPVDKNDLDSWWNRLYQGAVNSAHSWYVASKALAGGTIPANLNPGIAMENFRVFGAKVEHWLKVAPRAFSTNAVIPGARSFYDILNSVKAVSPAEASVGSMREFVRYITAKHLEWIHNNNPNEKTGVVPLDAATVANDPAYVSRYEALNQERIAFKNNLLDYYQASGMKSAAEVAAIKAANPFHIHMFREIPELADMGVGGRGDVVKKREGSLRDIKDPIASDIQMTYAIIKRAEMNHVASLLGDLADQHPDNPYINRADGPVKGNIPRYIDGERVDYAGHQQLKEAWDSMTPQNTGLLVKILSAPAMLERSGFTGAPDFSLRHVFRANFLAPIISDNVSLRDPLSLLPFGRMIQGFGMLLDKNLVGQAEIDGAMRGGLADLSRTTLRGEIYDISKQTGLLDKAYNVIRTPLDAFMGAAHAIVNTATRATALAEYKAAIDAGKPAAQAALEARQIGLDYQRTGSSDAARTLNKLTAFQNAGIQGFDTIVRAFKRDAVGTMLKTVLYVGIPTLTNWLINKDDSRYKNAPQWQKDLFWLIPMDKWEASSAEAAAFAPDDLKRQRSDGTWEVNNGAMFRLPKPFEAGIFFGSLLERTLDALFTDKPDAFKGFDKAVGHALPGAVPSFMQPMLEHWANKSVLTGNPIVNHMAEKLLPEYRYSDYTTETAKYLGQFAGKVPYGEESGLASPAVLENYIRAWTGTIGMYALHAADASLEMAGVTSPPPKPESTLADWPIIKAFVVRHPSSGMAELEDFHQSYEAASQHVATVQQLVKDGDVKAAMHLQGLLYNPELAGAGMAPGVSAEGAFLPPPKLTAINQSLSTLTGLIHRVNIDPSMTPSDKRQLIDGYYYQMNQMARYGNELTRTFNRALKGAR